MNDTTTAHPRPDEEEVVIVAAVRTPVGRRRGVLAGFTAVELGAHAVRAAFDRVPGVDTDVAQVIVGNVLQAGNGQNVARQVAVAAGLDTSVPAVTVNEVCGSGMKAVMLADQLIRMGRADVVVAAGTESMTRAPLVSAYDPDTQTYRDPEPSMVIDGLEDAFSKRAMGLTAETVSERLNIDRESQDEWAFRSQSRASAASRAGLFDDEIAAITLPSGDVIDRDESIRHATTLDGLAALDPVFADEGTVTAGNASPVSDGAAALVLVSAAYAHAHSLAVLARVVDFAEVGVDPSIMGFAPHDAIRALLQRNGLHPGDVDRYEINEAFAATTLAVQRELDLDEDTVNVNGGALALGHPLGSSGARILVTLIHELLHSATRRGIAALCVGGGMGLATMVEAPSSVAPSIGLEDKASTAVKLYELSPARRRALLVERGVLSPEANRVFSSHSGLPADIAENLIENQIGQTHLPLGILDGLVVNGLSYTVAMSTEEPSVVAAANNGARIVREAGGFTARCSGRLMPGQIVIANPSDPSLADRIMERREELIAVANAAHPSILLRGGGLKELRVRAVDGPNGASGFLSVDLSVDVRDAMGANIIDTIGEAIADRLTDLFPDEEVLFAIVSNYATESLVTVTCDVPASLLSPRRDVGVADAARTGADTARRIALASDFAEVDVHRAVTHNKGLMNGIDAVALAAGNDTRAVEAACHAWASRSGRYRGLARWSFAESVLHGELTLPLPMATAGGASRILPSARAAIDLVGVEDAAEFARVTAAVGLAQNLAALRALVTDGIQKGHMSLQARARGVARDSGR